ncbi:hypothetical protein BH11MYX3_BH11MYX3_19840 [soil metagenome]
MQGVLLVTAAWIALAGGCVASDDESGGQGARATGYLSFEKINERSFPTAQHQGAPLVNVWTDELATAPYRALSGGSASAGEVPEGGMIVKEMFDANGGAPVLTVMVKQPTGYDPTQGDWWYGRLNVDGSATNAKFVGKVGFCIGCHRGAAGGDHLFGVASDNLTPPP